MGCVGNAQNRENREPGEMLQENLHLFAPAMGTYKERKREGTATIFCESVAGKVKDPRKFVSPSKVICRSTAPSMVVWGDGASEEVG